MRTGGEGNKKSLHCNYFPVAARHIMVQFCHFAINYPNSPPAEQRCHKQKILIDTHQKWRNVHLPVFLLLVFDS